MPINVQADVINLTSDQPKATDKFLIDSNVWYWIGYSNASIQPKVGSVSYPNYINQALNVGCQLYKCTLSFSELAHSVERSEWEIYKQVQKNNIDLKTFRHNFPTERLNTISQIESAWALADVVTAGLTIEVNLDNNAIALAQARMKSEALDGYDLFMVEAMLAAGITQVITGDGDFGQVAGIKVFTVNQNLLSAAAQQGKLLTR